MVVRPCGPGEAATILEIVNAAAEAYRGVIPADRWHDPYMGAAELEREIAAGVQFSACEVNNQVVGVMGMQPVRDVHLIRHAYVRPSWATATWAIRFYERNGFTLVPEAAKARLLRTYWTIPERQIETSVVLASPALTP